MISSILLKPVRSWIFSLHEETRLLREETIALRGDIAEMRKDVREVMEMLSQLMGELKKMKEQMPYDHEDDTPNWQM